jgi:hypothetical protein
MRRGPLHTLVPWALAVVVVVAGGAKSANAQEQPRPPTELWQMYPLDPVKGETNPAIGANDQSRSTTTTEEEREPIAEVQPSERAPETSSEGASFVLGVAVVIGLVVLVIAAGALPESSTRQSVAPTGGDANPGELDLTRTLATSKPTHPLPDDFDVEESAEGRAPPKVDARGTKPPSKKILLIPAAPPPKKQVHVASALPPGKSLAHDDQPPPAKGGSASPRSSSKR